MAWHGRARASASGIIICPTDLLYLWSGNYVLLMVTLSRDGIKLIIVPSYDGRRENPIVLARRTGAEPLAHGANLGCKRCIAHDPDIVVKAQTASNCFIRDIDSMRRL